MPVTITFPAGNSTDWPFLKVVDAMPTGPERQQLIQRLFDNGSVRFTTTKGKSITATLKSKASAAKADDTPVPEDDPTPTPTPRTKRENDSGLRLYAAEVGCLFHLTASVPIWAYSREHATSIAERAFSGEYPQDSPLAFYEYQDQFADSLRALFTDLRNTEGMCVETHDIIDPDDHDLDPEIALNRPDNPDPYELLEDEDETAMAA